MGWLKTYLFHMDSWLLDMLQLHPGYVFMLIFLIVLCESAFFPVAPLLPGDGLLFALGILSINNESTLLIGIPILILGSTLGNFIAYYWGMRNGVGLFDKIRWLNRKHYQSTQLFFEKNGSKAILFSRFIPVLRALIPFFAGVIKMDRKQFTRSNITAVTIWVVSITLSGYLLGHIPMVKKYFGLFVLSLFVFFILGILISYLRKSHIRKTIKPK